MSTVSGEHGDEVRPLLGAKKGVRVSLPGGTGGREAGQQPQREIRYGGLWTQLRTFAKIAIPFFYSDRVALVMLVGLILLTILSNGISVLFSYVKSWVFNALNEKDEASFWRYIELFFAVLVVAVPISVSYTYLRLNLALRWRQGFTKRVLNLYYQHRTYYILEMLRDAEDDQLDNPDQRIADDINSFTSTSLMFFFILLDAVVNLVSFSIVLFQILPSLFFAIVLYAGLGTLLTACLGRPLLSLYYDQMKKEANFRFGLIRTRENCEAIAFYDETCEQERVTVWQLFEHVVGVQFNIIRVQRNLEVFTTSFDYLSFVVPYVVVAPLYFSGKIELGSITQASEAFWNVRSDFSIFVSYFEELSLFAAGLQRLHNFVQRIEEGSWEKDGDITPSPDSNKRSSLSGIGKAGHGGDDRSGDGGDLKGEEAAATVSLDVAGHFPGNGAFRIALKVLPMSRSASVGGAESYRRIVLHCADLSVATPDGRRVLLGGQGILPDSAGEVAPRGSDLAGRGVDLTVYSGDRILVSGKSGCGKSSLLRVIAGLWASGSGTVDWYTGADDDAESIDENEVGEKGLGEVQGHGLGKSGVFFLPQKPYNQLTTLRQAVKYPKGEDMFSDGERNNEIIVQILERVMLGGLVGRFGLDSVCDWSKVLSTGEQQRLAFARVLYSRPVVVVADEATSALGKAFFYAESSQQFSSPSFYFHTRQGGGGGHVQPAQGAGLHLYLGRARLVAHAAPHEEDRALWRREARRGRRLLQPLNSEHEYKLFSPTKKRTKLLMLYTLIQ